MSGEGTEVLGEALEQFESELTQLAWQMVRLVFERELARRPKARPDKEPRRARAVKARKPAPAPRRRKAAPPQLELGLLAAPPPSAPSSAAAPASAPAPGAEVSAAASTAAPGAAPGVATGLATGKRRKWTRETVIEELATWMVNGTALDAQFLTRHGPPGLVAAARRIFGRFDAALNVAGLHFAKLYPDGPPVRKRGAPAPAPTAGAVAAPALATSAAPEQSATPALETSPE